MNETKATTTWIAVLDSRKGRLFEMRRLPTGRLHLDSRGELAEAWDEKLHHRPYMLSSKGRSVAAFQHEDEERVRRFGKQAAQWLDEQVRGHALSRLTVFCAPSLIGPLRKALTAQLSERLDLRQEDLAWFTPGELAEHPSVAGRLG
jgi:protein required for attachment to host cells